MNELTPDLLPFILIFSEPLPDDTVEQGLTLRTKVTGETTDDD